MQNSLKQSPTEWLFQAKDLRYLYVFGLLFSHPKLACGLLSLRSFWAQTLLTGGLLCLLGGLLLSMNEVAKYGKDVRKATEFVLKTVNTVEFSGGKIRWADEYNEGLPASTALEHYQLDIVESWKKFRPAKKTSFQTGFVLSKDGLGIWNRGEDGTLALQQLILPAKHIPQGMEPYVLNVRTQPSFCRFIFLVLFGSLFFANGLLLLESLFMTAAILCAVWMFIGQVRKFSAIHHFLMMGFNLAFPPFLVALIWSIAGIPLDFDSIFCITFLLYLLYGVFEGRNGILRPK